MKNKGTKKQDYALDGRKEDGLLQSTNNQILLEFKSSIREIWSTSDINTLNAQWSYYSCVFPNVSWLHIRTFASFEWQRQAGIFSQSGPSAAGVAASAYTCSLHSNSSKWENIWWQRLYQSCFNFISSSWHLTSKTTSLPCFCVNFVRWLIFLSGSVCWFSPNFSRAGVPAGFGTGQLENLVHTKPKAVGA